MDMVLVILLSALALAALVFLGVLLALLIRERGRSEALRTALQASAVQLAQEQTLRRGLETSGETLRSVLEVQASRSAEAVTEHLLARAAETFRSHDQLAQARLEAQLKPVADTLSRFEAQVQAVEKARSEDVGGLKAQIAALMQASIDTQTEARRLSGALRRGAGVQGRWGEQTLRNVLQTAGLAERFDFEEQFSLDTEEGRRRCGSREAASS
jgi:DNA recombination protein RmuC